MLQALAHQALGDIPAALACLERALTLAEPEGYVRVFADEGPPMASLLRAAAKQGTPGTMSAGSWPPSSATEHDSPVRQALIEPLSERELDVLRLLGTELDGPAIARELMVSLNTMRTHTKNIYAKLARDQPPGSGPPGRGTRPAAANPQPPTLTLAGAAPGASHAESPHQSPRVVMPAHHIRS